jgi:hypothetical protein
VPASNKLKHFCVAGQFDPFHVLSCQCSLERIRRSGFSESEYVSAANGLSTVSGLLVALNGGCHFANRKPRPDDPSRPRCGSVHTVQSIVLTAAKQRPEFAKHREYGGKHRPSLRSSTQGVGRGQNSGLDSEFRYSYRPTVVTIAFLRFIGHGGRQIDTK